MIPIPNPVTWIFSALYRKDWSICLKNRKLQIDIVNNLKKHPEDWKVIQDKKMLHSEGISSYSFENEKHNITFKCRSYSIDVQVPSEIKFKDHNCSILHEYVKDIWECRSLTPLDFMTQHVNSETGFFKYQFQENTYTYGQIVFWCNANIQGSYFIIEKYSTNSHECWFKDEADLVQMKLELCGK